MNENKTKWQKFTDVLVTVFGYVVLAILILGGLSFFAFVVAFFIGGDAAAAITTFLSKKFYPILVMTSTISLLFAMLIFYLRGDLSAKKKKKAEAGAPKEDSANAEAPAEENK